MTAIINTPSSLINIVAQLNSGNGFSRTQPLDPCALWQGLVVLSPEPSSDNGHDVLNLSVR